MQKLTYYIISYIFYLIKILNDEFEEKILFMNFNQDYNCFCIGTEDGYIIFNVDKYKRIFHRSNYIFI